MYAVNWNDHSGQNLSALVNVDAWPNVRVSTLISEVSYPEGFVLLVSYVQSAPSCLLAPGLLPWLMSQEVALISAVCFIVGS